MKLKKSKVVFDEKTHTYLLDGFPLSGITSIINAMLFPNKYGDVPVEVLKKAAERGSAVHKAIEDYIKQGIIDPVEELNNFIDLCAIEKIVPLQSEYLVSDEDRIASCIDMVDEAFNLYDFKTTYSLDKSYVSWQLSVYAYLFELQNPKAKAGKLFAIHLRNGEAKLVEVERKDPETIKQLIDAYFDGVPFEYESAMDKSDTLHNLATLAVKIKEAKAYLESLEESEVTLKTALIAEMKENKIDECECDGIRFKYSPASQRVSFDSTRFKAENPDLYKQFSKTTEIAESLRITIK